MPADSGRKTKLKTTGGGPSSKAQTLLKVKEEKVEGKKRAEGKRKSSRLQKLTQNSDNDEVIEIDEDIPSDQMTTNNPEPTVASPVKEVSSANITADTSGKSKQTSSSMLPIFSEEVRISLIFDMSVSCFIYSHFDSHLLSNNRLLKKMKGTNLVILFMLKHHMKILMLILT